MDSLVGKSVVVQVRGQLQPATIRASTKLLTSVNSDLSSTNVLLEWDGDGGEGKGRREWLKLTDSSKLQAVYLESKLLWVKRMITVEQSRRAVAWPSKSFRLLCSNVHQYHEVMVVEYFCDRERIRLYVEDSQKETKELHLSEAKGTLISHPYLLAELEEWEESRRDHTHMLTGQNNLTGQSELSYQEEGSQAVRLVNPLLVHVVFRHSSTVGRCGGGGGDGGNLHRSNSQSLQQMPPHLVGSSTDLLLDGNGESLLSPHLPSPALQESTSPVFPSLSSSSTSTISPVTAYRTPSIDLHRRSSLHNIEASRMSEPNLFRRSSVDQQKIGSVFGYLQEAGSYNTSPLIHSPTPLIQSTSVSQGSPVIGGHLGGSLQGEPSLASPQTPLHSTERSKSLENIAHSLQPMATNPFKRRMSTQVPSGSLLSKRPRYDLVLASPDTALTTSSSTSLHRSMSLSALSRHSHTPFTLGGRGHHSTSDNHDDELDMIKEIIDRDDCLVGHGSQHSLTGIPAELSVSLPALHPTESLQVLHAYNSAPVIAHPSSSSATPTGHTPLKNPTEPLLPVGLMSGINGTITDFLTETFTPKDPDFPPPSDVFSFSSSSPSTSSTPYLLNQSSNSAHCLHSDSAQSSELKPTFTNFNPLTTGLISSFHPHLQSTSLSDMLHVNSSSSDPSSSSSLLRSALSAPIFPTPSSTSSSASTSATSASSTAQATDKKPESAQVARDPEVLCGGEGREGGNTVTSGEEGGGEGEGGGGGGGGGGDGGELNIAVIVNQHASIVDPTPDLSPNECLAMRESGEEDRESGGKGKLGRKAVKEVKSGVKRGRGRPRLTEEEKQRRKELRELGLMKRSHRRTKEEVAQWRAERILSPAKRGRKPGSGKKNVVKAVTGKEVYVSVDLSKYQPGTVILQNGFCRAFPDLPRCMECGTCEGDLPSNRYCRFLEFRKIRLVEAEEPKLQVEGFATYTDVQATDLVPWTPLKAGYSHMDAESAIFILQRVAPHFVGVVSAEAATLPDGEVIPVWKRAVQGLREMCDTCDTAIFNFHWICPHCGFAVCPACYQMAWDLEEGYDVPSLSHRGWPNCTTGSLPHLPSSLIVAQIIPANVLSDVLLRMLKICEAHHMRQEVPRPLQQLISLISRQMLQTRFQNNRKGKPVKPRSLRCSVDSGGCDSSLTSPVGPLRPSPLATSPRPFPSTSASTSASSSSSSFSTTVNGREDVAFPSSLPHSWLCQNTLLCLHDPYQPDNMAAFQHQWRRGRPVIVAGVDRGLSTDMWTPRAFSRDFGEDYSELVDCFRNFPLPHFPSHVFWDGFEDISQRLRDPVSGEPRLLKQKDWPPGEDFSEKLPKRFEDLMAALPLPHYTKRDGKLNMVSSLPDFFVKPDMGPKMYNAYGSPVHPTSGTTNLHLDISDATNVMVYCSVATGAEEEEEMIRETVKTECCEQTYWRVTSSKSLRVGALWHIYAASDADKIRAFLTKVLEERGMEQVPGTDPIHDQLIYLDSELRQRIRQEHGVQGWAIAQAVGDAIFIPAGAPHQVRNLCSCIKVAEDFVSPEHIEECVKLTEEFRLLSDTHVNHEDKLQVKNIIYHSLKDIVGILSSSTK